MLHLEYQIQGQIWVVEFVGFVGMSCRIIFQPLVLPHDQMDFVYFLDSSVLLLFLTIHILHNKYRENGNCWGEIFFSLT